jgi:3-hydroxyisobutyrate dehydrogenase
MSKPRLAMCGLGMMGAGMARRLLAAGFPLSIYNRTPEKAAPFAAEGAQVVPTPREAAARADIILCMVADDGASRDVWLGETGAMSGATPGAVLIESSTLSVRWVKELAAAAATGKCELLDAPVTGSRNQAAAGELCFLVGGSAAALEKARPVLSAMGRLIVHLGPSGNGALLKLVNNFLCGVQAASLAEAIALIERSDLPRDSALDFLKRGAPGSPMIQTLADRMSRQDYSPNFQLRLLTKDLAYAIAEARRQSMELTTAASALEVFKQAISLGHGEEDMAAVIKQFRET